MGKQNSKIFSPHDYVDDLITVNSVHGAFYGSAMNPAKVDALVAAHVPREHLSDIAAVYSTKWWDYRRLSPGHSFLLFTNHYYRTFRLSARKVLAHKARDHRMAQLIGVGSTQYQTEDIWERDKAHITGMMKAMLVADSYGIPYDKYCSTSFECAIDNAWTRLPRPNQMYSDKLGALTVNRWNDISSERLFIAHHPLYLLENYVGRPVQDEYREWLIDQIATRDNPVPALSQAVYGRAQIPEDMARNHFPAATLNRARILAT